MSGFLLILESMPKDKEKKNKIWRHRTSIRTWLGYDTDVEITLKVSMTNMMRALMEIWNQ